ncbi:Conserved protein containing a Zn-ribbon-like motif, possibly RNA-binding [Sinosporangium album]|uniref:Conserved protein containing a Zn-ribbon-like motif, possibly RNA-binding n=1 Tax=Sinosporangium album TaxID=504805 RepID=A0A1G8LUP5_9ACTN|nr:ABATE domain-containing protein [Sinosporangium album]SDI59398.1 Conserved protein containing a Zn-ribbon-like motif, possibly RNA-binding [Sinosporangium album]
MVERAQTGPPVTGEPLPLDLVNTTFVDGGLRGHVVDVLTTPAQLDAWLTSHLDQFSADLRARLATASTNSVALEEWLALREALRNCFTALTDGTDPNPRDLDVINRAAAGAAHHLELKQTDTLTARRRWQTDDPVRVALGEVAAGACEFAFPDRRGRLRACPAPGCILFFEKTHPRREWCSPACGNRVRVARHSLSGN